ncbi:MAG TPA: 16S rRNA (cytosine(1402)-N(4))-methyltransferase RsmH [Atribacteraceae bacterium]|nr:16S rRNA (cytosine(1402)-N(4))-methyltransferase RsmH [Atribacteraceae bacterium]
MNKYRFHRPVMTGEVCRCLAHRSDGIYVDCTVGGGGHARALFLVLSGKARLVGIDRDPDALDAARGWLDPFRSRLTLIQGSFSDIDRILDSLQITQVSGILCDLGVSSRQLDTPHRGFSFREDGPLDMRMDPGQTLSAGQVINTFPERELADILYRYGEERKSRRIARSIVRYREKKPVETTGELAGIIRRALGWSRGKIDPATRSFQAIRIFVNHELEELRNALEKVPALLEPGGKIVILSYHSLEDRQVKTFFRGDSRLVVETKKPILTGNNEIKENPRSRSARLRVARKAPVPEGEKP